MLLCLTLEYWPNRLLLCIILIISQLFKYPQQSAREMKLTEINMYMMLYCEMPQIFRTTELQQKWICLTRDIDNLILNSVVIPCFWTRSYSRHMILLHSSNTKRTFITALSHIDTWLCKKEGQVIDVSSSTISPLLPSRIIWRISRYGGTINSGKNFSPMKQPWKPEQQKKKGKWQPLIIKIHVTNGKLLLCHHISRYSRYQTESCWCPESWLFIFLHVHTQRRAPVLLSNR